VSPIRVRVRLSLRSVTAAVFTAIFAAALPAAITAAWVRGTVLSTSGYVAAVGRLAADPAILSAVRTTAASEIDLVLNRAASTLPRAAAILARPLSNGLAGFADNEIDSILTSQAFQQLWIAANTSAHRQLISILNGNSTAVATTNGEVVLNLAPLVSAVLKGISSRLSEMTGNAITLPAISSIPAANCQQIASLTHTWLPPDCGQVPLFPASALANARRAYRILSNATLALLILAPASGAAALLAAPRRRHALILLTIGGALCVFVTSIAVAQLQSSLIARARPRYHPAAAALLHALTGGFFTLTLWCVISSLILATAALLSGLHFRATALPGHCTTASSLHGEAAPPSVPGG
jgi:hypothetical protein